MEIFFVLIFPGLPILWAALQVYALLQLRGWPRLVSSVPIVEMAAVLWLTYEWYQRQSNLWPILLVPASLVASLWVLLVLFVARRRARA